MSFPGDPSPVGEIMNLGDTEATASFDVVLPDGSKGSLHLPPGDYSVGYPSKVCPDVKYTISGEG